MLSQSQKKIQTKASIVTTHRVYEKTRWKRTYYLKIMTTFGRPILFFFWFFGAMTFLQNRKLHAQAKYGQQFVLKNTHTLPRIHGILA